MNQIKDSAQPTLKPYQNASSVEKVRSLGIDAMTLVRVAGISSPTAYKFMNGESVSVTTAWRIYTELKKAGYDVSITDFLSE